MSLYDFSGGQCGLALKTIGNLEYAVAEGREIMACAGRFAGEGVKEPCAVEVGATERPLPRAALVEDEGVAAACSRMAADNHLDHGTAFARRQFFFAVLIRGVVLPPGAARNAGVAHEAVEPPRVGLRLMRVRIVAAGVVADNAHVTPPPGCASGVAFRAEVDVEGVEWREEDKPPAFFRVGPQFAKGIVRYESGALAKNVAGCETAGLAAADRAAHVAAAIANSAAIWSCLRGVGFILLGVG